MSKLSPLVRELGYTGSPLPLAEWSRLREIIESSPQRDTSKRVHLPPVIVSCALCKKQVTEAHRGIDGKSSSITSFRLSELAKAPLSSTFKFQRTTTSSPMEF